MGKFYRFRASVLRPATAAALNFSVWGSGYIFNRRRYFLGAALIVLWAVLGLGVPASLGMPSLGLLAVCSVLVWVALLRGQHRRLVLISVASFTLALWMGIPASLLGLKAIYAAAAVLVACWLFLSFSIAWDAYSDAKIAGGVDKCRE